MSQDSIRVVCRLRPLNKIEIANKGQECVSFSPRDLTLAIDENKYNFAFDRVFGPATQQVEVYKEVALPVVRAVIGGFNGTIFAYGQTGGGKTWTMEGPNHHDAEFRGLIPRTIEGLFEAIAEGDTNVEYIVKCSYIEIYNEKLFDLLDPSKSRLEIKEDRLRGVFIQNCTEVSVGNAQQMLKHMDSGSNNRKVAFTGMNQRSSRSHSLFIIHVGQKNLKKDSTKQSKLYFVDLAGSEKVSKTGCQGQQLEEAKNINKSLSSLGNVINALTSQKKEHIPYRDSKLTRILQQSLGGNSKTTLIINCSICSYNDKETLSTLRFGYRAKSIKNKAKVNEEKSAKELLILLDAANRTIAELRQQMGGKFPIKADEIEETDFRSDCQVQELKEQLQAMRVEEEQRQRQIRDMQMRIKNVLLELSDTKQASARHQQACGRAMKTLKASLFRLNKYMSRVYIDLEYWLNNLIIDGSPESEQINNNLTLTFQNIMDFTSFYQKELRPLFNESQPEPPEKQQKPQPSTDRSRDRNPTKKIKLIYSQPTLSQANPVIGQQLQMSCIVDKRQRQDMTIVNSSDKVSQEESSLSQIETLLQSLETKESQRFLIEEMSANMRALKKQNDELLTRNEQLLAENKAAIEQIELRYQEKMIDLEQRVQEYRNIIKEKDGEITSYIKELEKERNLITNQKVVSQRLRKIIQNSQNLKGHYQMQQRLRSLASQRQKLFNELYRLRGQLDEAEVNILEKEEVIDSLKQVMQELSHPAPQLTEQQIEKKYKQEVYGTETPNIVVAVKGGSKNDSAQSKGKQSALRKKVNHLHDKKEEEEKANFLPFIKGFFT